MHNIKPQNSNTKPWYINKFHGKNNLRKVFENRKDFNMIKVEYERNLANWDRTLRIVIGLFLLLLAAINLGLPIFVNVIIALVGISQLIEGAIGY